MRKMFLSSAGIVPETKKYFLELLGKDPKDTLVVFIPTAAGPEKDKSYVQWTIDQIEELGMKSETVDLVDENEKSLENKLSKCDVIIMNGGNTFYLLDQMRKSGFNKIIYKLLDEGKIYLGVSAGSYVTCPTIEAATWKNADTNVVNLKDLTGLNLVPFIISAHYDREKYYQALLGGVNSIKLPVVALTDKQAVLVEGDNYKVVGEGERNFFNGFKEVL